MNELSAISLPSRPAGALLFLMGPSSSFWRELSTAFEAEGRRVIKVCFSLGDWLYWRKRGACHFRGRLSRWPDYLERLIEAEGITDILLYGDRQPYHLAAGKIADELGIRVIAIENGYLRPDWLTVERGGMGTYSHFPNDPNTIRKLASGLPDPDLTIAYRHGFWTEMFHEGAYQMVTYFWRVLYPFYRSGKYYDPLLELLAGIPKLYRIQPSERDATRIIEEHVTSGAPFYVTALQLQGDYQIRAHSPYDHIRDMIRDVIASFARNAPPEARLVFKQHPHDSGWENWSRHVRTHAEERGIGARVAFIDGGDLGKLLKHSRGCVMINSTVGLFSLRLGCPTKILGVAIYDMPGLTHQGSLDDFWRAPEAVDSELAADFVKVLAATIQVKGSFYDPAGRAAAIQAIVARVLSGKVNEPGAFVDPPPRLTPKALDAGA
jgi:capsular polysaccharide export protein